MKDITTFINESYNFDLDTVAGAIIDIASEVLGNKIKSSDSNEIINIASEGEYTDYDKVAELLDADPDEIYDFVDDNYDKLSKIIDKNKRNY